MSPEQFQYIWRKTIPHIEVGMGSGVFQTERLGRSLFTFDFHCLRNQKKKRIVLENRVTNIVEEGGGAVVVSASVDEVVYLGLLKTDNN
ncbi:hypothetical protein KSP39_PZI000786 [Platanthera zijinensis]|uniref:Uncharacterized protein n=1 Tax=Platanthera zijinensis TaxID=2320716 RepID=A0AAP0C023_9ASPA